MIKKKLFSTLQRVLLKCILNAFLILLCTPNSSAENDSLIIKSFFIDGKDTIVYSEIKEVNIRSFHSKEDRRLYYIINKKTRKLYPIALTLSNKLDSINLALDSIPKRRKKRRYIKATEKWFKNEYVPILKKLSRWDGRILSKLIYRQTKVSTYEIVKNLKGGLYASFWQGMARLYDNNLKTPFDVVNNKEDQYIEEIIYQIESEQ